MKKPKKQIEANEEILDLEEVEKEEEFVEEATPEIEEGLDLEEEIEEIEESKESPPREQPSKQVKTQRISANQIKQLRESALVLSKTIYEVTQSLGGLPKEIALSLSKAPVPKAPGGQIPLFLSLAALFFSLLSVVLSRNSRSLVMERLDKVERVQPKEIAVNKPVTSVPVAPPKNKKRP